MIQSQRNELDLEKKKIELIKKEKILTDALKLLEQWRLKIQITRTELQNSLRQIKGNQELVQNSLDSVGQKRGNLFAILQGIQGQLKIKDIDVEVAENGTVLRIPEKSLSFDSGEYEIPERFRDTAKIIGNVLLEELEKKETLEILDTVFIEGHTDSVPFDRGEKGNWGLSTYRAISLWQFWTEEPGEIKGLKNLKAQERVVNKGNDQLDLKNINKVLKPIKFKEKPLFSVSGYANLRPSGERQEPPKNRELRPGENSKDRRIDIRFTLAPSEEQDLNKVRENMANMANGIDDLIEKISSELDETSAVDSDSLLEQMDSLKEEIE
ncbi:OmpA family protein [Verrucomicrobia bacterium]|nr:OmpA family protein [Verrucomicrobiota bacterium]